MKCLFCYNELETKGTDFHSECSKKFFGIPQAPIVPFSENEISELAKQFIQSQISVPGVQPKISLHLQSAEKPDGIKKLTLVGMWGGYILKPPSPLYPYLPEVEDLTMHLAQIVGIKTVPHSLIKMQNGSLAYITKRIDRIKKSKLQMEDMCQLSDRLSEEKYQSSYEQIAKTILKYSSMPILDVVDFYEQVLFSFITGNADMHLKNFSLIEYKGLGHVLSPAYDMVATVLVNPSDDEDLALNLNGKKKKIKKSDFIKAFTQSLLEKSQQEKIFQKMFDAKTLWIQKINESFLPINLKKDYQHLIEERLNRIELGN